MSTVTPIPTDRQRLTHISIPTDMHMAILMGRPAGMTMNTRVATALTVTDISIARLIHIEEPPVLVGVELTSH